MTHQPPEGLEPCPKRISQGHDRASFNRGVRASISWLHDHAETMSDPHAKNLLNSAAWQLGQDKPSIGSSETDTRSPSPALAEGVKALEEAQYAFDCIAEDFEISDGCTAEMLCGDKICEGGCIDRRRQVIRTALANLRNLMGEEGGS